MHERKSRTQGEGAGQMADIREEKRRLRRLAREKRDQMSPEAQAEASRRIRDRITALPEYRKAGTVMAYVSMPGEPDTREIIRDAVNRGKRVLLPRCTDREHMEAVPFTGEADLVPGRWEIPEPKPEIPAIQPTDEGPEIILVPCAAASRDGKRLGHGAGYYDRFLREMTGMRICLCFEALLMEDLPTDELDVKMDRVLTEANTLV